MQKAKIVAADWGTEFIQFLTPLAISCTMTILKNRINSSFSSNHPGTIHPIHQIGLVELASDKESNINSAPQTAATTFAFSSVSSSSLHYPLYCKVYSRKKRKFEE